MICSEEFFIQTHETEKMLFVSRTENIKSETFSPCCMTPDDVDYEMQTGKHPEILEICGMNQKSFEHFVRHYAKNYRYLYFFKCQLISDFSPLADLEKLETVRIYWNIRTDKLWNFEKNTALHTLSVSDAKKITRNPDLLKTSKHLKTVAISGSAFENYPMESLECFSDLPSLQTLWLSNIRLLDHSMNFLHTLPNLQQFDFDAGMLTTEEIARIVAEYPALSGKSLCAYNTEDAVLNDVRVCGTRKPGLDIPAHQKRLDKYIAEFNALVEAYRKEIQSR